MLLSTTGINICKVQSLSIVVLKCTVWFVNRNYFIPKVYVLKFSCVGVKNGSHTRDLKQRIERDLC